MFSRSTYDTFLANLKSMLSKCTGKRWAPKMQNDCIASERNDMYHTYESLLVLLSLSDLTRAYFTRASCPAKFWSPKSRIRKTGTLLLSLDLWLMIWSEKKTLKNCQNAIQNLRACRIEHKLRPTIPMARNYGNKLWLCRSRPGNPIVES